VYKQIRISIQGNIGRTSRDGVGRGGLIASAMRGGIFYNATTKHHFEWLDEAVQATLISQDYYACSGQSIH